MITSDRGPVSAKTDTGNWVVITKPQCCLPDRRAIRVCPFCWLLRQLFRKTQSSSESKVASLAGLVATIVSPIPENGVGEIAYVQAGTRYTAPARAESGVAISAGQSVKITRVIGSQFYVTQA